MLNMQKKEIVSIASIAAVVIVAILISYTIFWWVMAARIKGAARDMTLNLQEQGYVVSGGPVAVTGFPGRHKIHFEGRISGGGRELIIPSLDATGFFLPGNEIILELPRGMEVADPMDEFGLWSLESATVSFIVPKELPSELRHSELQDWQEHRNKLEITAFDIRRQDVLLQGRGVLELDSSLQPVIEAQVRIRGHLDFVNTLIQNGVITERQGAFSAALLAAASRIDEKTGELWLESNLSVRDQNLYVGPVRVASLPEIEWSRPDQDTHSQPAPPQ